MPHLEIMRIMSKRPEGIFMASYKFDGKVLKDGSKTIANVKDDAIREGIGSRVIANIKGDDIREGTGSKVLYNLKGDDIRQGTGSSKIATMKDVNRDIDGHGRLHIAALWLLFCR